MADIADVMDALETLSREAVFPNGDDKPSVISPRTVQVGQGWPLARDLDKAANTNQTLVSVYAVPSSTSDVAQPFNTTDVVTVPPNLGTTVTSDEGSFTLSGTPNPDEYVSVETAPGLVFSASATSASTASSVAADLAAKLSAVYPGVTQVGGKVVLDPPTPSLIMKQGGPATVARRTHRQRTQFRICVWSPNPADRSKVARTVDVALKTKSQITLADWSQGLVVYMGTNLDDKFENEGLYRRDLIYNVTYDTVETYQGFVVTNVQVAVSRQ